MKISLNTIRFVNERYRSAGDPAPNGIDDLLEKIGAQLGAVEEVVHYGDRFKGAVIVKIVACEDHPNADRLHVCKIDDGGKVEGVERDEQGYVQVVCGAPNARKGITVVWLPPGATVPESVGKDPFVLEARPLRGVVSNGMLASPRELTIGDSHEGILEIDRDIVPGTSFAEAFNLESDAVIDIENKMFTHRPDCFGSLGIARELEGIQRRPYRSPEWYAVDAPVPNGEAEPLRLEVRNEIPELVPRFTTITMRDVVVKSSPIWLQVLLSELGLRPINNVVDYTNFFMLETGQPLHAYDYDKVMAQDEGADHATIVIRHPHENEKITLLNGKEIEPRSEAIMIATRDKLIGVGGVMGGQDTEVDTNTKNIIIEAANFDMYSIRRTSMAHGLFTDAVTRFNKGQSPLQTRAVLAKIVDEIRQFADGKVASELIDDNHLTDEVMQRGSVHSPVTVTREFINARLGFDLTSEEMSTLLTNVEFAVTIDDDSLTITAPFWRTDIEIPEDIVEEIGRLYGFDHLPLDLPIRTLTPAAKNTMLTFKQQLRSSLVKAGANEVLTYSFVHGNLLNKVGQNTADAYQLSNALSPDLQYYRISLTPSLLEKVHSNSKAGYDQFALFEIGKAHILGKLDEEGLPKEFERLACVIAADTKAGKELAGTAFYQARVYLMAVLDACNLAEKVTFKSFEEQEADPATSYYESGRAATIMLGDTVLGRIGEYKVSVRKALKLPDCCAGFELGLSGLFQEVQKVANNRYIRLPRFPKVEQDICLKVPANMTYEQVFDFVRQKLQEVQPEQVYPQLTPVDIYQRSDDADHKQITLRYTIASYERTMTDQEVAKMLDHVADVAKTELGVERI